MTTRDQPCIAVEFMALQKENDSDGKKSSNGIAFYVYVFDMIYLLTAIVLSRGSSTHLHTNNT